MEADAQIVLDLEILSSIKVTFFFSFFFLLDVAKEYTNYIRV